MSTVSRRIRRVMGIAAAIVGLLDLYLAAKHRPVFGLGNVRYGRAATIEGSRYLLLVSGATLVPNARQLWRGKQRAWQVSLLALMVSLIAHPIRHADLIGVAPSAALAFALVLTAGHFTARSDPARAAEGLIWLIGGAFGVVAYGTLGLFLLDHDFAEEYGLGRSFTQAMRLLFLQPVDSIDTVSRHGSWFVDSVRVSALAILLVSLWHFVRPSVVRGTAGRVERHAVREILEHHATTGLAYFHLLGEKQHLISRDGRAVLSYRVIGETAVALGEPIGAPDACIVLAHEFDEHCDLHGWRVAYHQVGPDGARLLETVGYRTLKIGEEAIVPVQEFSLEGSHRKRLRNKNRQLLKEGIVVETLTQPIDDRTMAELREVSDAWLADGGHRERTFTLGWFDPDYLRDTTVVVVRSAERIEAFANILPHFAGTVGNFDLMRRRPDSPNGIMDLLFVHLIERFAAEGCTGMTLGFAPLANIEGTGVVARVLRALYEQENAAFNFKGLHSFKAKWDPIWEPRYLVYRSELELPQLAYAVARVGEKPDNAPRLLRVGLPR